LFRALDLRQRIFQKIPRDDRRGQLPLLARGRHVRT
jgi:hypothetical protein